MATKKLMIAAVSARGYALATAACGYEVVALDVFADADTRQVCAHTFKLKFNENDHGFSLDEADFKRVFEQVNLSEIGGFLYGSLFDNCPDLLTWVAHRIRLVGNAPEVLKQAKDFSFFAFLDDLNIAHPEVHLPENSTYPSFPRRRESSLTLNFETKKMDSRLRGNDEVENVWLCKQIGGSGGTHIKPANQAKIGHYFQRKMAGTPISMLFVADGKTAKTIGFNQQFAAPTIEMPYRFSGAVNNIALQPNIHAAFEHAAQQLTSALKLRGLNNLDAILNNDGLWILELNPRLSASFNLYENLMHQHLSGCAGSLVEFTPQNKQSIAQLILYADSNIEIPVDFVWPLWAVDIPAESSVRIVENMPICSIFASAENAESATNLVQQRTQLLKDMLDK